MSKFKVKLLTKADEVRETTPEELEVKNCTSCGERIILKINEKEEKKIIPKIKKKEPTIQEVKKEINEEFNDAKIIKQTYDFRDPQTIKHEHSIKISLTAMIFSTVSLIIMILLLKFM